ncbi:thioredoxin family protein [Mycoplasma corogypsi]|uniref:thioredoxin family protein n=1 Tax=Mycoplasma corogypsi TaxID=2106 RepID=UPI003872E1F7
MKTKNKITKNKIKQYGGKMQELKWEKAEKIIEQMHSDQLIFLVFTTKWCGDCKMMKPILNQVYEKYKNNKQITFMEVDAEESQMFRNPNTKYQVLRVPTMLFIKEGQIIEKGYEYIPEEVLSNWIEKQLS